LSTPIHIVVEFVELEYNQRVLKPVAGEPLPKALKGAAAVAYTVFLLGFELGE